MLIKRLPSGLENAEALIKRRDKAAANKELWRDTYREAQEYSMPQRETFSWYSPGQRKNQELYDSTGQDCTYLAANNMQALLCPAWKPWSALAPGSEVTKEEAEDPDTIELLQEATGVLFSHINHSNFSTVIPEAMLDLMIGTCAISIDEGEGDQAFVFDAIPLSIIEIEEGPNGTVETTWMQRMPLGRNLVRMYRGLTEKDLPEMLRARIRKKPDDEVKIIQGYVYDPKTRHYFGLVIELQSKAIIWRYDYGDTKPMVVARASVVSGETYGRGRVMMALPDIKTLDRMQEFVLRHSALQVAPPLTAVTDGVFNPYTASLTPNTVLPVASNDNGNPTIRVLEMGGNFSITEAMMDKLEQRVRRILLADTMSEAGPIKSATEIAIGDRNRMWNMGAEFGRIQAELLAPIVARCVWILKKRGKMPPLKVNGRQVTLKYVSPLARAQDQEDLLALQQALEISTSVAAIAGEAGQMAMMASWKIEEFPAWIAKRTGLDASLVRSKEEKKEMAKKAEKTMQDQQPTAPPAAAPTPIRKVA